MSLLIWDYRYIVNIRLALLTLDVAEGKCRRDTVTKTKQWLRETSEYRSLFLSK
jgi:hypothetical protein